MSEHNVEDLIEESVRLVAASPRDDAAKREMIGELFVLQNLYDTSNTMGRVDDLLTKLDYGDDAPPSGRPLLATIADAVGDADAAGDRQLVHHWLALLVDGVDMYHLGKEQIGDDFAAFAADPAVVAIRETALRHDVFGPPPQHAYFKLSKWSGLRRTHVRLDPGTIDRRYMARLLTDTKSDVAAIVAAYDREKATIAKLDDSPVFDLGEMVEARGPFRLAWRDHDDKYLRFVFAINQKVDDADGERCFLMIQYTRELGLLTLEVGVRSGLIARWQGHDDETALHFRRDQAGFVPEAELDADPGYNRLGGWMYQMHKPAKLLHTRLDAMLAAWPHACKVLRFHAKPLADRIDAEGPDKMMAKRRQRAMTYGFFGDDIEILLACACRSWDRGIRPDALIADIRERLSHVHPWVSERVEWVRCLRALETGAAFPAELATMPHRVQDETIPLDE